MLEVIGRRSAAWARGARQILVLSLAVHAPAIAGESEWPAPAPGWKTPASGEHPRLFFRKGDLPALKKRAASPEGKAILTRLRATLGGGEQMPAQYQESTAAYQDKSKNLTEGAYTLWHGAGFGLLYQITGDKKYADLGRKCVEKAFEGQRDRDDRYSWKDPGGFLRAGPSIGAIAMAYDLCYDGWDDAFRKQVANAMLKYDGGRTNRDGGGQQTMAKMATAPHMPPFSNHYAPQVGGVALCLLAIKGDPDVDAALVEKYLAATEKNVITALTKGFGDHGAFAEGEGPGVIASDTALVPAMQAFRIAGGKDFIGPRPNASWMTLKWVYGTLPGPSFPHRGNYPHNVYARTGLSGAGTFAQGFGAVPPEFRGALLWTYNHCVAQGKPPDWDAFNYPQRPVFAFVNWPLGEPEKNPGDLFPRMVADRTWGTTWFRNRWQDADDIVISALPKGHGGYHKVPGGNVFVWGFKERVQVPFSGQCTDWIEKKTGGVVVTDGGSLGVDFSGAAGVDGLVVIVGPASSQVKADGPKIKAQSAAAGGKTVTILTLAGSGQHPTAKAEGNKVLLGGQTIVLEDTRLTFVK
jgi:hypothetical protein